MANAQDVLELSLHEAILLSCTGGSLEEIRPLLVLAHQACLAGDGDIPDEEIRESGMDPTRLARIGL